MSSHQQGKFCSSDIKKKKREKMRNECAGDVLAEDVKAIGKIETFRIARTHQGSRHRGKDGKRRANHAKGMTMSGDERHRNRHKVRGHGLP